MWLQAMTLNYVILKGFLVGFLWPCLCHLWYTKSQYPKVCLAYQDVCTYVLLVTFSSQRLSDAYPCVSLINQVLVIHSLTISHTLALLCFMWVVSDSRDSCKWIIISLNRFVHWKVRFQGLLFTYALLQDIECFFNDFPIVSQRSRTEVSFIWPSFIILINHSDNFRFIFNVFLCFISWRWRQ